MDLPDRTVISLGDWETSLEDFKSEAPQPAPQAGPTTPPPPRLPADRPIPSKIELGVSLAELRAAGVRMDSYEAVAVVQALCQTVVESEGRGGTEVLDTNGVFVNPDGSVSAISAGPRNRVAAVQCLGMILSQLLPDHDFMFLRERVVEKATSAPPVYSSLEELSQTLAYYERRDRNQLIRAVYDRWQERRTLPPPNAPLAERVIPPILIELIRGRSHYIGATVAVLLMLSAMGGAVYWMTAPGQRAGPAVTVDTPIVSAVDAGRKSHPSTNAPVTASVPPAPAAIAPPRTVLSTPPVGQRNKNSVVERSRPAFKKSNEPTQTPSVAIPEPSSARAPDPLPPSVPRLVIQSDDLTPARIAPAEPAVNAESEIAVYSARNLDVMPPIVLYSPWLSPSPLETREHLTALEVLVNERGAVDSVRAMARPRNIAESVLLTNGLSAAKAWRFRPAVKDGHAVRYRLLVALITD